MAKKLVVIRSDDGTYVLYYDGEPRLALTPVEDDDGVHIFLHPVNATISIEPCKELGYGLIWDKK